MGEGSIGLDSVPALEGVDVDSAKKWVRKLAGPAGGGWHADDGAASIVRSGTGAPLFTPEAARSVDGCMARLRRASAGWPDPDFLYELVGEGGAFAVEEDYPGFVVDACVPGAGRTGYVSVPGRKGPSLVVEEGGRFALVEFAGPGRASEAAAVTVSAVEGCRFRGVGEDGSYIDFSGMRPVAGESHECRNLQEVEEALVAIGTAPAARPA